MSAHETTAGATNVWREGMVVRQGAQPDCRPVTDLIDQKREGKEEKRGRGGGGEEGEKRGRLGGGFDKLVTGDNLEMSTKRAIKKHFRRDYI